MIPRDWMLVVRGHADQARAGKPGADAPSKAAVAVQHTKLESAARREAEKEAWAERLRALAAEVGP